MYKFCDNINYWYYIIRWALLATIMHSRWTITKTAHKCHSTPRSETPLYNHVVGQTIGQESENSLYLFIAKQKSLITDPSAKKSICPSIRISGPLIRWPNGDKFMSRNSNPFSAPKIILLQSWCFKNRRYSALLRHRIHPYKRWRFQTIL